MLGVSNDATGAFRIYDLEKIPRRLFDLVTEKGYAFFFQSIFILAENRFDNFMIAAGRLSQRGPSK